MALLEDAFKDRPLVVAGLGLLALALPLGIPSLRKRWVAALGEGVKLEASGEAEIELMDTLAEFALGQFVEALAQPKDEHEQRIEHVITKYKNRAHARSNRWARTETGREELYQQHISHLRSKVAGRHASAAGKKQAAWEGFLRKMG